MSDNIIYNKVRSGRWNRPGEKSISDGLLHSKLKTRP